MKQPADARLSELRRWFEVSFDPFGDAPFESLTEYALRKLPDVRFVDGALESIAGRLETCAAKSPKQFRQWCYRQIDRFARKCRDLDGDAEAGRSLKHPFVYEVHAERAFIKVEDAKGNTLPWIVPASWIEQARRLWPVHVRRFNDGTPYISKKSRVLNHDGRSGQKNVPVHRVFLNCRPGDVVVTTRGNYLDFTDVRIREPLGSVDIWGKGSRVSVERLNDISGFDPLNQGWMPTKPKRCPPAE